MKRILRNVKDAEYHTLTLSPLLTGMDMPNPPDPQGTPAVCTRPEVVTAKFTKPAAEAEKLTAKYPFDGIV